MVGAGANDGELFLLARELDAADAVCDAEAEAAATLMDSRRCGSVVFTSGLRVRLSARVREDCAALLEAAELLCDHGCISAEDAG